MLGEKDSKIAVKKLYLRKKFQFENRFQKVMFEEKL